MDRIKVDASGSLDLTQLFEICIIGIGLWLIFKFNPFEIGILPQTFYTNCKMVPKVPSKWKKKKKKENLQQQSLGMDTAIERESMDDYCIAYVHNENDVFNNTSSGSIIYM